MDYKFGTFWQSLLVWVLFLASIAALFINSVTAFFLPAQEQRIRESLRAACLNLVEAATDQDQQIPSDANALPVEIHQSLEKLTRQVLGQYPGVEGGFYVNHQHDDFAGYAFPTEPLHGPHREVRREPPRVKNPIFACKPDNRPSRTTANH